MPIPFLKALSDDLERKNRLMHEFLSDRRSSYTRKPRTSKKPSSRISKPKETSISDEEVKRFLSKARAVNTQKQYESIVRGYKDFMAMQDPSTTCFPLDPDMLVRYAAYLTKNNKGKETIMKYIRVLRTVDKSCKSTRRWSVADEEILRLAREAVRRIKGGSPPKQALTLTSEQLKKIAFLTPSSGDRSSSTAVLLGVAACLRPGELYALKKEDVKYSSKERTLVLTIREGKTDVERLGQDVIVGCVCKAGPSGDQICPVHRVKELLFRDNGERLFPKSEKQLDKDIRELLHLVTGDESRATAHALRRSAAHLMAANGLSAQEIADHGRWKTTTTVLNTYLRQSSSYNQRAAQYSYKMLDLKPPVEDEDETVKMRLLIAPLKSFQD
ncbi:hypothetical protein FOL47_002953 [Perkinsus chesapeaki]|uniref:Tyr recombinase domain-containing protein n=1 Tax=Perkinsus chesapeaki TaxID=330153 RepID=A0A7J6KNI8_PERCH|nr:hypothetical protein FOL47_002953 [Perkinsus chesapeaki]